MSSSDDDRHASSHDGHDDSERHNVKELVDDYDSDSEKKKHSENKQKYAPIILKKHVQVAPIIKPIIKPIIARNIKPEADKYKFCTMEYVLDTDTSHCSKCGFSLHSWYDKEY